MAAKTIGCHPPKVPVSLFPDVSESHGTQLTQLYPHLPVDTVCFLPDLDGGGAQRTMVNLVGHMPAEKVAARLVVARGDGPARQWLGRPDVLTNLGVGRTLQAVWPLRRLLADWRPRALLSTMLDANVLASVAAVGTGIPVVVRETNSHRARGDLSLAQRLGARWAYGRAARVVALSEGVRRELVADLALDPARTVTIHNPVDVSGMAARAARARAVAAPWGTWGADAPVVVAAGRLTHQKGFDLLLRAVASLRLAGARLVILGEGGDRNHLMALAAELGLADRLLMPGFVPDPVPWIAHADLFALSSRWEGFGHVVVEAMACGTAVIATDCPYGPAEILTHGENGWLCAIDPEALAECLATALADEGRRRDIASAGLLRAQDFSQDAIAACYADMLVAVAEERR